MRYNKLKNLSFLFFALALLISFVSCEKVEPVADESGLDFEEIRGTWIVSEYNGADISEFWYGPYQLTIYNTSFDDDSIWVDNIYDSGYKIKASTTSKSTFAVTNAVDVNGEHEGTIEISEAKVVDKDSIVFKVILYDVDGLVVDDYYEAGIRFNGHNY
jgi:uncharacterized lipoprotein YddW (UPF0748 family)